MVSQIAGSVLIVLSALLATACVAIYGSFHKWWRSPGGRHLFSFMAVFALVIDLWTLRLAVRDGNWFILIRLAAFAGVPVVLGWRLLLIVKAVIAERHERKEGER